MERDEREILGVERGQAAIDAMCAEEVAVAQMRILAVRLQELVAGRTPSASPPILNPNRTHRRRNRPAGQPRNPPPRMSRS
jgi:hypothetical protein